MWIDVDRFRYPSLCFRVVLESTSCLTQYRIMVMIMHSNGDTCPFDRDGMILWGVIPHHFAGRTRAMHVLYVCDCGAVAD